MEGGSRGEKRKAEIHQSRERRGLGIRVPVDTLKGRGDVYLSADREAGSIGETEDGVCEGNECG